MTEHKPIALKAYEELAESYSKIAETKAENGYIEHPAIRKQLGKVQGLKILDAGCGPGILASYLVLQGAKVTGFDISPKMIELARKRLGEKSEFFIADMARPLDFLKSDEFDIVASSLAIDYVKDWSTPLSEFYRVMKNNGRLVFTVQHPLGAYLWYKPQSAFGVQYVEATWRGFNEEPVIVPDYYRSFEEMINPLTKAGFVIKHIFDAKPIDALKEKDPIRFDKYSRIPTFMCIEAVKD
ncbi:MAG: hypothetical protein A2381_12455 [Bdellovibrionales bacterium RIFOXYB1_FULL_37_110]|nr:MAG: hypothetical protein A2417_14455 [Bdellovibrionales bacterium RIFOXYC1_FULL_37_79]OFZ57543.1 MAG: hypothetical protein A2381_12455 [Bdellovibrionales bacterium RIFOXYB1_FULL_37_110]